MDQNEFDKFCVRLPATENVIQWGNASVWKVGGKIFAICSVWGEGAGQKIGFKCSDLSYAMLIEQNGIIPAPYLARAKWVQVQDVNAMSDDDLRAYILQAHKIITAKLTRAKRSELGL